MIFINLSINNIYLASHTHLQYVFEVLNEGKTLKIFMKLKCFLLI